jgi:hypothetical protein
MSIIMLQGGNSISIHLQPSFRNSLFPWGTFPPPASHIDSLVAARIEEVGILHVEQKSNIRSGKRPCALVKSWLLHLKVCRKYTLP